MYAQSRTSAAKQSSGYPMSVQPALDWCISMESTGVSWIPHLMVGSTANCLSSKELPILYVEDQPYS